MYYLCFDVGGTITKCAVVTPNYEIVAKSSFPTEISRGGNDLLARMIKKLKKRKNITRFPGSPFRAPELSIARPGPLSSRTSGERVSGRELPEGDSGRSGS